MIKKCLYLLSFLTLLMFSCKKQEPSDTKFSLTANLRNNNSALLQWPSVKLSEFKNITIYRSTSPIPDPTFEKAIDGNLIIDVITDKTITSFIDSNINVGSNGTAYYKVVLNLSNRFIVSDQQQVTLNAFSLTLSSSQFNSNFIVKRLPEINALYVFDFSQGTISRVDYSQKKILATVGMPSNFSSNLVYPIINNNQPELFVYIGNSIICYDGLTLNLKYSINVSSNISDFKVKNGFLYVLPSNGYLATYDLSSKSQINQTYLPSSNNYSEDIFTGSQSNLLFTRYYAQNSYYQSSTNSYVYSYKNIMATYNLINGIPTNSTILNIPSLNGDTTNSINTNSNQYILLSPDGKYILCNQNGDIYSLYDNSTHNVRTSNNFNPNPVFSNDGKFLLVKTGNLLGMMDIYALPGFNLVTSLKTQNPTNTNSFAVLDDFMDNDSLISYNIERTFISNQSVNTLTVLFKKID